MQPIYTARLRLRMLEQADSVFYLRLINDKSFIENIRDKGIRTVEGAWDDIQKGPIDSQKNRGFSMYLVELAETATPLGLCGLVKRDTLTDVDLGYAFMPRFAGQGYAYEAAEAVLKLAFEELKLPRLAAITSLDNTASNKLLQKLGFAIERVGSLGEDSEILNIYTLPAEKYQSR